VTSVRKGPSGLVGEEQPAWPARRTTATMDRTLVLNMENTQLATTGGASILPRP
jgi:hypothetical protein